MVASAPNLPIVLGRYALYDPIASGGMATVHLGRLLGPVGFARTVAIKRLHPQYARDTEFVSMFLDEARLAARIRHPNVVPTVDIVALEGELFLVMEYVQGEPLGALVKAMARTGQPVPIPYAVAIVAGALRGLHAAHEAKDEHGNPLGIVHRDISPQNILVGVDGTARVLDFGVAKAAGRIQVTREGQIKGKLAYMPPEQIKSLGADRRTDIYASGAVLWEALTGARLFHGDNDVATFAKVLEGKVPKPSSLAPQVPPELDAIVLRALAMDPDERFPTARDMARALDASTPLVPTAEIGEWVEAAGAEHLANRTRTISRIEVDSSVSVRQQEGSAQPPTAERVGAPSLSVSVPVVPATPPEDLEGATQISGSSMVRSAVMPRFDRRWVLVGVGGAAFILALVAMIASGLFASKPKDLAKTEPQEPSAPPSASTPTATSPPTPTASAQSWVVTAKTPAEAPRSNAPAARAPASPIPMPVTPATATNPAIATAVAPLPPPPPSPPAAPAEAVSSRPKRRAAPSIDSVLDSRK